MLRLFRRNFSVLNNLRCKNENPTLEKVTGEASKKDSDESSSEKVRSLLEKSTEFVDIKPKGPEDEWATMPYVDGTAIRKKEVTDERDKLNPSNTSIVLFPGQGSQYIGMAKNFTKFPQARDMFEIASEVLKYDLLKMCLEGPEDKLNETLYCQPAIMVTSLAALEKLKEERPRAIENCVATAGFSLGEITALVFAGAIPFDDAVKLVQVRAKAMQEASNKNKGGMATILLNPDSKLGEACVKAKEWCVERGVEDPDCVVANYLFPHCKVVSGSEEALKYIELNMKKYKLKKMKRIPAYGAFHSKLMSSAVTPFKKALQKIELQEPIIGVYSNIDGHRYFNRNHILKKLPQQIVRPVKWEQTMHNFYDRNKDNNYPRTFICGPGNGLRTILKNVNAVADNDAYLIS